MTAPVSDTQPIQSVRFRVPRYVLARLASEEYVRTFWWFVIPVPAFGVIALAVGQGILQVVGMFAVLWPLSIPARSVLVTSKVGRALAAGLVLRLDNEKLQLVADDGGGSQLSLAAVKDLVLRNGFFLIRMRTTGFIPVPVDAFSSDEDRQRFVSGIAAAVDARLNGSAS